MEQRAFGKTGLKVSPLGFGGSEIGYQAVSPKIVAKILGTALDAGVNAIDTAECYPGSEELIGHAIAHRRDDYHLFTKCGHVGAALESLGYSEWDPRLLAKSIDQSLKSLRTDHLDLVQLHSCSEAVLRRGEVVSVLQHAKQAGKTRFIGYSGDGNDAIYAVNSGVFDTLQTSVNIADQESIERVIPIARDRGLGIIAKRPAANAIWFSGRVAADDYSRPYWDRLKELDFDFLKQPAAEAFATALRFTLSVPGVHTAIVGTTTPEHIASNVDAVSALLDKCAFEAIRSRWNEVAKPSWSGQT
jgi:hypothetical protein